MKKGSAAYILISILSVLALTAYLFLYRPLIYKLHINLDKCKAIENDLSNIRLKVGSVVIEPIERDIVFEDMALAAVDELTNSAKAGQVNFISVSPDKICASNYPDFKVLPVKIILESKFEDAANFLGSLFGLSKSLAKVTSFDVTQAEGSSDKIKMLLSLNLYVFSR